MTAPKDHLRLYGPIQLATAETDCWKCHKSTPSQSLMAEDIESFSSYAEVQPRRNNRRTFFYGVAADSMPPELTKSLEERAPHYKPTFSRTVQETSWASQCVHCGALLGAFFEHSEPDGPFFARPSEFLGSLEILSESGFDIDSASYSI